MKLNDAQETRALQRNQKALKKIREVVKIVRMGVGILWDSLGIHDISLRPRLYESFLQMVSCVMGSISTGKHRFVETTNFDDLCIYTETTYISQSSISQKEALALLFFTRPQLRCDQRRATLVVPSMCK